jgi:PAS domain S-box-containing protein
MYQYAVHPDGSDEFLYMSDRSREIYEYAPEALMRDSGLMWQMIHPDDLERVRTTNAIATQQLQPFDAEFRILPPSGQLKWIHVSALPARQPTGETLWDGIVMDMSDRKQAELALRQTVDDLAQANRLKDEFLAALSHELRTPLSPILGWTILMRSQQFTPDQTAQALDTIERNVRQQIRLVDDLLDISGAIQGKLNLTLRPVNLALTLQSAINTVQFAAQTKAITLTLHGLAELNLMADGDRLQQVFWNLLSNAIKFTPVGGQVQVDLAATATENPTESPSRFAQVRITDTGIGIAPEFLPHVFDPFRQADGSSTRQYGGLGLGLSIVRHWVELHGGAVSITNAGVGKGTIFTVTLPIHPEELAASQSVVLPADLSADSPAAKSVLHPHVDLDNLSFITSLTGTRILLVDDDRDNLDLLCFLLQQEGATVTAVSSPLAALEQVTQQPWDIIISDIGMPELDGYEFIQQVKTLPQCQAIPALAISAFIYPEDQEKALQSGFQAYITKPINPIELLTKLTQLINC